MSLLRPCSALVLAVLLAVGPARAQGTPTPPAASPSAEPVKLAALNFQGANVDPSVLSFFTEHYGQQLTIAGVQVVTPEQISALLGFERQKQLLACGEDSSSCLAELGNALGVDGLVRGSIGKFGDSYQLNIQVLSATTGQPMAVGSSRAASDTAVLDELTRMARAQAKDLQRQLGRGALAPGALAVTQSAPTRPAPGVVRARSNFPLVPVMLGSALALAGGLFVLTGAAADWSDVENPEAARNTAYVLGAAGLLGGGALIYFPVRNYRRDQKELEEASRVSVGFSSHGASVGLSGSF